MYPLNPYPPRDGRRSVLTDHHRWIEVHLDDHLDVDEADLLAFRTDLMAVDGWTTKPVLIHMGALTGVSLDVRERLGRYTHPAPVAVLGTTVMDEVLAAFFLRSPTRAKYFTSHEDALCWLDAQQSS